MVGLKLVHVPGLDHARVRGGHVDLAEMLEVLVVAPQDLHQAAAIVGDDLELLDHYSVDH